MKRFTFMILLSISTMKVPCLGICFSDFEADTAKSEVIFTGRVVNCFYNQFWVEDQRAISIYTFEVYSSYKGLDSSVSLLSILAPYPGRYGGFQKDSVYLVFARNYGEKSPVYFTYDCTSTTNVGSRSYDISVSRFNRPIRHKGLEAYHEEMIGRYRPSSFSDSLQSQINSLKNNYDSMVTEARNIQYLLTAGLGFCFVLLIFLLRKMYLLRRTK